MLAKLKAKILERTKIKKIIFFLLMDIVFIIFSCYFGFFLRFDGVIDPIYYPTIKWFIILTVPVIIDLYWFQGLYSMSWSFISIKELLGLGKAVIIGFFVIAAMLFIFRDYEVFRGFPRSVIFISGFLVFLSTGLFRFAKRIYFHGLRKDLPPGCKRVLIFGAGEAGEQLARYIITSYSSNYFPVGFVDDDHLKQGEEIHNVGVLGTREDIPQIIEKYEVEELIIALPSAPREIIREAVDLARSVGLEKIKIIPGTKDILEEKISLNHVRDVSIEDLLGRDTVKIDTQTIQSLIKGKIILVTGAAGSIGSYLSEEILKFSPERLICLDQDETGIFNLERKLEAPSTYINKSFVISNICDRGKINEVFNKFKPHIVFHAAAYKHVPLMEDHPEEAVKNNIFGLKVVTEAALKHGVEKFIFISTDKAVNPTSIMGMTKRVGEMICETANQRNHTKFISVRFGNVLDSRGNVISVFKDQIKKGGPIEITHPDMKRYFMVTQEAVLLVMQAGAMGEGGEVFVLDMGEPVKILDLARDIIKLSGFEPDKDIPIVFTKPRPGEKFFEDILTAEEGTIATRSQKIYIAKLLKVDKERLDNKLIEMVEVIKSYDREKIILIIKEIVGI